MHTDLSEITNGLLLNASWLKKNGIFNGKMGVVLYFSYYSRYIGESAYEHYTDQIFAEVIDSVHSETPTDFSDGLGGIGWAINLLISSSLIHADEDVLDEFDRTIVSRADQTDYAPEQTVGLLAYCTGRLRNHKMRNGNRRVLHEGVRYAIEQLNEQYTATRPQQFDITWPYPWILWHLDKITGTEPLKKTARNLRDDMLSQADSILRSSDLHPGNKFFLYLILRDIGYGTLDFGLPSDWLKSLHSPAVRDGFAGIMLLLTLFSGKADYYPLKQQVARRLNDCIVPGNPYVYDLKKTPPQHSFGLLHGTSGIGLVKLLTREYPFFPDPDAP